MLVKDIIDSDLQTLLCMSLKVLHLQYIEEPTSCWEDNIRFYQETGVPIALDETLDAAMQAPQVWHAYTCLPASFFLLTLENFHDTCWKSV